MAADWILLDGRVWTGDPRRPLARGLAIAGSRIAALGDRAALRAWRDRRTRVVDLRGATVIPGVIDAHAHLDREGLKYVYPSLETCRSIPDLQALIRKLAARTPRGEWIVTMPLGQPPFYLDQPSMLAERRWPTREDLDAAAPDHPVYIRGIWGYWNRPPVYSVASSLALARAGIGRDTRAPGGVEIERDAAGEPTGVLVEHNLVQVMEATLMRAAPRFTHPMRLRALRDSQRRYARWGVTGVYEGHGVAPELLRVYRESHERGELVLRCVLALSPTWPGAEEGGRAIADLSAWAGGRGTGDERLRVSGIALHWGGDAEVARHLHAAQPYTAWAGFVESANTPESYAAQAEACARHGVRVNTIVTRSLPQVLEAWEAVAARQPFRELRWVAVHLHAASGDELARLRRLGAVATTNPISYLWRSGAAEAARLGAERLIPHRSLARLRLPFGLATDNKPPNPWLAFAAAVARRDMATGEVLGPRERLPRPAALRALTHGGAYVSGDERQRGTLAVGQRADLAVLELDPLAAPLDELAEAPARLTLVGGEVAHGAP
jgi:predicted amidohydrolase YtcJ